VSVKQIIDTCLKGWELGDGALSLSVTTDSFCYDDPNTGRIPPDVFVEFVEDFKHAAIAVGTLKIPTRSCVTATSSSRTTNCRRRF